MTGFLIGFSLGIASTSALWAASWLAGRGGSGAPFRQPQPPPVLPALPAAMQDISTATQYPDWPTGAFDALIFGRHL